MPNSYRVGDKLYVSPALFKELADSMLLAKGTMEEDTVARWANGITGSLFDLRPGGADVGKRVEVVVNYYLVGGGDA